MKIAVLIGGIAYEVQRHLLEGIMEYAHGKNISIFVFTCNGDIYRQTEYGIGEYHIFNLPDLKSYDGIIYSKNTIQNEEMGNKLTEMIQKSGVPAISIEAQIDGMTRFYVDNRKAMGQMAAHLVKKHNVQRIYYLSGPRQNHESKERWEGAHDSLRKQGVTLDDENTYYGDFWVESGKQLVKQLLNRQTDLPEAIICANDDMAIGTFLELRNAKIKVGDEIRITGFDHTSDTDNLSPGITTVKKPQFEMGYEACKALVKKADLKEREFQVRCCYRGSCGCHESKKKVLEEVQIRDIERRLAMMSMSELTKILASDLNDYDNLHDFCECLKLHISKTDFTFFYLCLCEEYPTSHAIEYRYDIREDYTERIHIPIAYENGSFQEYGYFDKRQLLPQACLEKSKGNTYIVMPLHFRKNCLGYCVMAGSDWPIRSTQFQNWIMNISNALENIKKQSALKSLVNKLNDMWVMDTMTKVFNRAGFYRFADKILEECKQEDKPIGIVFVDINKLKRVNDNYGHEEGDFYIMSVAKKMKKLKKHGEIIMRYGGDEFVVLGKVIDETYYQNYQELLNQELDSCRIKHNKPYEMSASVGFHLAIINQYFKLDALIENADKEMYKIKRMMNDRG